MRYEPECEDCGHTCECDAERLPNPEACRNYHDDWYFHEKLAYCEDCGSQHFCEQCGHYTPLALAYCDNHTEYTCSSNKCLARHEGCDL